LSPTGEECLSDADALLTSRSPTCEQPALQWPGATPAPELPHLSHLAASPLKNGAYYEIQLRKKTTVANATMPSPPDASSEGAVSNADYRTLLDFFAERKSAAYYDGVDGK
jgi:hypothetical protein